MQYYCPQCNSHRLCVAVTVFAVLEQTDDGNISTDATSGDHEWDNDSAMQCRECNYSARAYEFDTEE